MSLTWRETKRDPKTGIPFKQSDCGLYTIAVFGGEHPDQRVMTLCYSDNGIGYGILTERFPYDSRIRQEAAADKCRAAANAHADKLKSQATA